VPLINFNSRQIDMRRMVPRGRYRAKILGSTRSGQHSGWIHPDHNDSKSKRF